MVSTAQRAPWPTLRILDRPPSRTVTADCMARIFKQRKREAFEVTSLRSSGWVKSRLSQRRTVFSQLSSLDRS
jgi:hypothetical protein